MGEPSIRPQEHFESYSWKRRDHDQPCPGFPCDEGNLVRLYCLKTCFIRGLCGILRIDVIMCVLSQVAKTKYHRLINNRNLWNRDV